MVRYEGYVPAVAQPIFNAAKEGRDLLPVLNDITAEFGFDTFTCGVSMSTRPNEDSHIHVVTTMPPEWLNVYNKFSYIEIDPRMQTLLSTFLPIIWDQTTFRGKNRRVDEFLDTALQYGLGSGIAIGFIDRRGHAVSVALNSKQELMSDTRKTFVVQAMGDLFLFAHFFVEMFVAAIIEQKLRPACQGAPLSQRERQCLALAANGQTGDDIALKLGITPRTVQFHFDSIRSKLGVTSRQEAVAKGVQAGIVSHAQM